MRLQLTHVTSYTDKLYVALNLRLLVLAHKKYQLMVFSSIPADTVTYKTFYRLLNFSIMIFFSKIPFVSTVFAVLCRFYFFTLQLEYWNWSLGLKCAPRFSANYNFLYFSRLRLISFSLFSAVLGTKFSDFLSKKFSG